VNPSQNEPPIVDNPFFHRGPIRNLRYFFGRVEETRNALDMLRNDQCVSIVGPRRIGKTSLLLHLCDPGVQREHNVGTDFLFVYIDGQTLGGLNESQFYEWLWQEAKRALPQQGETIGWPDRIADFGGFRDAMRMVREKGYRLAFLFDEFDSIALESNLGQKVFSNLRSLVPAFVIYVTASQDGLYSLTYADKSVLRSPFFNVFSKIPLSFLTSQEAAEMVGKLLGAAGQDDLFTGEDLGFAFEIAGYHPLFLQLACYHLFEYKSRDKATAVVDYAHVRQRYAEDAADYFDYVWKGLNLGEQEAVRLVLKRSDTELGDEQRRRLERKCLLYNNAVFSSAFAEFVQRQPVQPVAKSNERVQKPTRQENRIRDYVEKWTRPARQLHILHLSDIHLGTLPEAQKYRIQLETDLNKELKINKLEYLVISGDVANYSTQNEYEAAFELIDGLVKHFQVEADRVIIVPGNHDLNWEMSERAYPFVLKRNLPDPLPEGRYIPAGDVGALLRDDELYKKRFTNFAHLYKQVCAQLCRTRHSA
jgi:hypothetical protein